MRGRRTTGCAATTSVCRGITRRTLGTPGAEPLIVGFDVVVLDGDRIARVHGFLDKIPG
ncbi:hypothetical protein [Nocardia sp. BSTN01]|uniref:hypothetical protein n=1 Tax=Nocardia sp. BSTN01 TaxID=2783665 RepID=UPI0028150193|nr:hypothetical protein [Nocardia sp. BSTN01]